MDKRIKTVQTTYLIKVNNDFIDSRPTLKSAKNFIKTLTIHDDINTVTIVKQSITERPVFLYQTKTTKILIASELDSDLTFD